MSLSVQIEKHFNDFCLRAEFTAGNETLALMGSSGSGKSLTLRCIAGVEKPDRGRIVLNDRVLFDSEKNICLSPQERHTGLLFQHYALFPHMTVYQNVMCGIRRTRRDGTEAVRQILESFGLADLKDRLPGQLSGGQQQRTALARILVSEPDVLMLDEPFSALDSHLHFHLEQELRQIIRKFGKPVLLVSHNRDEVYRLADRTAIMDNGQIVEIADTGSIFLHPSTLAGCRLAGYRNLSDICTDGPNHIEACAWGIRLAIPLEPDTAAIAIPARAFRLHGDENAVVCRVTDVIRNPQSVFVLLMPDAAPASAEPMTWELSRDVWQSIQAETLTVHIPPEEIIQLKG